MVACSCIFRVIAGRKVLISACMSHAQYRYTRKYMYTEQVCIVVGLVFVWWERELSAGVRCTCMYDLRFAVASCMSAWFWCALACLQGWLWTGRVLFHRISKHQHSDALNGSRHLEQSSIFARHVDSVVTVLMCIPGDCLSDLNRRLFLCL